MEELQIVDATVIEAERLVALLAILTSLDFNTVAPCDFRMHTTDVDEQSVVEIYPYVVVATKFEFGSLTAILNRRVYFCRETAVGFFILEIIRFTDNTFVEPKIIERCKITFRVILCIILFNL